MEQERIVGHQRKCSNYHLTEQQKSRIHIYRKCYIGSNEILAFIKQTT